MCAKNRVDIFSSFLDIRQNVEWPRFLAHPVDRSRQLSIGVGDGGRGRGGHVPPKIRGKIFFGQLLCKTRAFFGQNYVKLGNFVNFPGKC